jgi:hypothetical protein
MVNLLCGIIEVSGNFSLQKTIIILTGNNACETNRSIFIRENSTPHFIAGTDPLRSHLCLPNQYQRYCKQLL